MKDLCNSARQEMGCWASNRVETSHLHFRRRERAIQRLHQMKTLQRFSTVHAAFHNHFDQDRQIISRDDYGGPRPAAQADWQALAA
jgi:putative transposase